jgi:cytochrome c oxidase assembly protein subunit 15
MVQSFINHPINVHFMHRTLAYLLFTLIIFWYGNVTKAAKNFPSSLLYKVSKWPFILVLLQVVLGIVTVISAPKIVFGKFGSYELLAELHQLVAMFLLIALVVNLYAVHNKKMT